MQTLAKNYDVYNAKKEELLDLMANTGQSLNILGLPSLGGNLVKTQEKLSNSAFKIMVVGDFNSGKSTLINGMLGGFVLPTDVLECTAVITEVKYSKEKYAILYFKNPVPEYTNYDYVTSKAKAHIDKYKGKNIPSLRLSIEEIDDFLVIQRDQETMEAKDAVNESPFERMELFWPCDLCENGVEIIDSPGLNATEAKEKITIDYLDKIDSLIFVLSALQLCKNNEMRFIEDKLQTRGFEHTFFIVNRLNQVNGSRSETVEEARRKVLLDAQNRLRGKTKFGDQGIISVNAYNAEQGRVNKDQSLEQDSGIIQFEQQMAVFLTKERGKVKLSQPAKELKNTLVDALVNIIPNQYKLNEASLEVVAKKYNEVKPKLEMLEAKRKQITTKMENRIADKEQDIKRFFEARFKQVSDSLYTYIDQIDIEKKLNLLPWKTKESAKAIIGELVDKLQPIIIDEQKHWTTIELEPYIKRLTDNFNDDFETHLKVICSEIDELKINITAEAEGAPSTFDKVMGVALGILCQDFVVGGVGVALGWKSALGNLGIQAGLMAGLLLAGVTNPVTIIPVLIASGIIQLLIGANGFSKKIISKAKPQIKMAFDEKIPSEVEKCVGKILMNFHDQIDVVGTALDNEIQVIHEQFETAIKEKQNAEHSAADRKAAIMKCETVLRNIMKGVDDIYDYLLSI